MSDKPTRKSTSSSKADESAPERKTEQAASAVAGVDHSTERRETPDGDAAWDNGHPLGEQNPHVDDGADRGVDDLSREELIERGIPEQLVDGRDPDAKLID